MNIVTWSNHSFNYERMKRMENAIQIFKNDELGQIRTVVIGNEPYFVGKDVAGVLGYSNSRKALADHVDDEDKGVTKCDTLGGKQDLQVINESGVYSLVFGSKLPTAKKFKRWVTSEVLPAIRKHGGYLTPEKVEKDDNYGKNEIMGGGPQKSHCLYRCRSRADLRGFSHLQAFPPAGAGNHGKPGAGRNTCRCNAGSQ